MLEKGKRFDSGYSTFADDEGVNYREIAEIMTVLGFPMGHSSARNYVLRSMKKFCAVLAQEWGIELSEEETMQIVKNPGFQCGIADLMHLIEAERRQGS